MKKFVRIFLSVMIFLTLLPYYVSAGFVSTCGPSGGFGGQSFYIWPGSPRETMKISEIRICAGALIDSIQVVYKYDNGVEQVEGPFGGTGGAQYVFRLDDDEYIKTISGRRDNAIHSLNIVTNKKTRTYGGNGGSENFIYSTPDNIEIAGFFGRSGKYINALGVHYRIIDPSQWVADKEQLGNFGNSGGDGGYPFNISPPKGDYTISEIYVYAENIINGIQISYNHLVNGTNRTQSIVWGSPYGQKNTFVLEPNEYITEINGKYGDFIDSIQFTTNKNRISPRYGGDGGAQWYKYEAPKESKINGLTGTYNSAPCDETHIVSIGVTTEANFPSGANLAEARIYTPRGSAVSAFIQREEPPEKLKKIDETFERMIKERGYNAYIQNSSTATYSCHGYAWHGNSSGEKFHIPGDIVPIYWKDGSFFEINESEARSGDILYIDGKDHSAIITGRADQGLWCISKWGMGPLVSHLCKHFPNYTSSDNSRYFRKR